MPSILENIQKTTSKPAVRGILGAAAFGFNPLLGLLAAPGIKTLREKRALENEKMRAELALTNDQRNQILNQQQAARTIGRNLGHDPLMEQIDPRFDILNESQRQARAEDKRGQTLEAAALLSPTATGQNLSASILPPPPTKPPADVALMEWIAANDPKFAALPGQEQFQIVSDAQSKGNEDLSAMVDMVRLQMLQGELEKERQEQSDAAARGTAAVSDVLYSASKLWEANNALEETFLETGSVGENFRRGIAGGITEGAELFDYPELAQEYGAQIEAYDDFVKFSADLTTNLVSSLDAAGVSLDARFRQDMQKGLANITANPKTNRKIIANTLRKTLTLLDAQGKTIPGMETYRELLKEMEAYDDPKKQTPGLPTDFNTLTREEQIELLRLMTEEKQMGK